MAKLPSFQFYPGDWRKDPNLSRCSKAAKGVWWDMICLMFECEERGVFISAGAPWSDNDIAMAVGGDITENLSCLQELLAKGVAARDNRGAIYSRRIVRDEQKRKLCQDAGKRGGNPTLKGEVKGMVNGSVNQNLTPSSSSSTSSSDKKEKIKKEKIRAGPFVKPTPQQVEEYARSMGITINGAKFCDSYETKGWIAGKVPMKNWQAAVRTWDRNAKEWAQNQAPAAPNPIQRERDRLADLKAMRSIWRASGLSLCHGKQIVVDMSMDPGKQRWCDECRRFLDEHGAEIREAET